MRPWEVLSVEQAMDQITYGGEWYREPLGSYTTGPPYIAEWNKDVIVSALSQRKKKFFFSACWLLNLTFGLFVIL